MTVNPEWLSLLFTRELATLGRELELFADERQIWQAAPGVTNAVGTLTLHLCGNLQHYVGAILGGTGYVRNREQEFSARGLSRASLLAEIERTAEVVRTVLPGLSEEGLAALYPDVLGNGIRLPTGLFLLHLSAHLAHHLGQAGYLRRMITGETTSAGAVPMKVLSEAIGA